MPAFGRFTLFLALALIASDGFFWEGDSAQGGLVAESLFDWASPEINHPLTSANLQAFRARLVGQPFFFSSDRLPA